MGLFLLACFPCFMITVSFVLTYYSSRYWYRNILLLINPWPRKLKPANIRILLSRLTAICCSTKGGFPVMAEITRILAANICRQFFFVVTITASTRCLVDNFQLICYSQRVNARHNTTTVVVQDVQNGRTIGWLQWWNIAGPLSKEKEAAEEDD